MLERIDFFITDLSGNNGKTGGGHPGVCCRCFEIVERGLVCALAIELIDGFIPVTLAPMRAVGDIGIELRRGATLVKVTWPLVAAADCAAWMRESFKGSTHDSRRGRVADGRAARHACRDRVVRRSAHERREFRSRTAGLNIHITRPGLCG